MPDIAKCLGENCPLRDNCYRYTSKPDLLQTYFTHSPNKEGACEYQIENVKLQKNRLNLETVPLL